MICNGITLTDFRNIEYARVSFGAGVTVLYGDNAQGKTNLLEAIYYAAIGKSFRGQNAPEIIRFGAPMASLSLDFTASGRQQNITMRLFRDRARAVEKNRVRINKMSELVGSFRAVLFCPEHLSLVKGGPGERRQFLDIAISGKEPLYLATLQRYAHILKQRNALLKSAKQSPEQFEATIEIWSRQLAHEGAYLARSRKRYIEKAEGYLKHCFAEMMGERELPALCYQGPCKGEDTDYEDLPKTEQYLFGRLCSNLEREIAAGATLYGPHKDDIEILLNGRPARLFGSQGQQRSLSLALKIAEGEICREDCGEYPVFLFDDVLSELDTGRRAFLLRKMEGKQVIMTSCEGAEAGIDASIRVSDGKILQNEE